MSASLVWKSLQLFDVDSTKSGGRATNKKAGDKKNHKDLIPTRRHGVKKEIRRVKKQERNQRSTILGDRDLLLPSLRRSRSTKCLNVDKTEENVKKLQQLTETPAIDLKTAQKILQRATGQKIILVEEEKDTSTLFTEADFKRFSKNYVPDTS